VRGILGFVGLWEGEEGLRLCLRCWWRIQESVNFVEVAFVFCVFLFLFLSLASLVENWNG